MSRKLTDLEAKSRLNNVFKGSIICNSKYKGLNVKYSFTCTVCGYTWKTTFNIMVNGHSGCSECNKALDDKTIREKLKTIHKNSIICLETYKTGRIKHRFKCNVCGTVWSTYYSLIIHNGTGCPKCGIEKMKASKTGRVRGNKYYTSKKNENVLGIQLLNRSGKEVAIAIIDKEDFERCSKHTWVLHYGYVTTTKVGRLHSFIMNCPEGKFVDHINLNPLDNRKSKLRICSNGENSRNRDKQANNRSGYKGVYRVGSKYAAQITINGNQRHLGTFDSKLKAAKIYNKAAIKYHGEFARLNEV